MAVSELKGSKRRMGKLICVGILLALLLPLEGNGEPLDLDEVVANLQATYEGIQDLSARFRQTSTPKTSGAKEESSGMLQLKKPGKMRWDYKEPEARSIISDGVNLYIYSPEDRQVIVQEVAKVLTYSAVSLLTGMGDLRRDFHIRWGKSDAKVSKGNLVLELKPIQPGGQVESVILEVNPKTFLVERIDLKDLYSNLTSLAFKRVKTNTGLDDKLFTFVPPPGTEIIKGTPGGKRK